jgi:uncharacterized damage-inducible protein DinB
LIRALEAWLDFHRDTLLLKCTGLTASQLKERAVPPSQLSLLGLVRHMAEVGRWWFRMHAANDDMPFPYDPDQPGQDFEALDEADAAANIEAFKQEVRHARAAVAGKQLDDVVPSQGNHPERTRDIRWIYLHMIEEYARHNGHADLIRNGSTASPVTERPPAAPGRSILGGMGRMILKILGAILAIWLVFMAIGWIFAMLKTFVIIGLIAVVVFIGVSLLSKRSRRS